MGVGWVRRFSRDAGPPCSWPGVLQGSGWPASHAGDSSAVGGVRQRSSTWSSVTVKFCWSARHRDGHISEAARGGGGEACREPLLNARLYTSTVRPSAEETEAGKVR